MVAQLTVTGWVMNTHSLNIQHSKRFARHDVLAVFVDEFTDLARQSLAIRPQLLLIDFTAGVANTAFAWGFMQRIQVSGDLQTVLTTSSRNSMVATDNRARVVSIERNWTNRQLATKPNRQLNQLARSFKRIRTMFVKGRSDFSTYQKQLVATASVLTPHQHQFLLSMLQQQRHAWAHLTSQHQDELIRRTVLMDGQAVVAWRGSVTLKKHESAQQVTFISPLPRINRRRLASISYRHDTLAPLRRSVRRWQQAGRPVDLPLVIPPFLTQQYKLWQDTFREPTDRTTAQ